MSRSLVCKSTNSKKEYVEEGEEFQKEFEILLVESEWEKNEILNRMVSSRENHQNSASLIHENWYQTEQDQSKTAWCNQAAFECHLEMQVDEATLWLHHFQGQQML